MRVQGEFHSQGYAVIEKLLPVEVAQAFIARMEHDLAAQKLSYQSFAMEQLLSRQSTVEILGTSYPPMLTLLWGLTPIVSHLVDRELLPTFDYFRIYQQGDICRVHSDRPACEYSLSLTLAYSDGKPWSLELGRNRVDAPSDLYESFGSEPHSSVTLQPGDALLYQGVYQRHGRVSPNPNRWSAHLFLHWVDRDGPYQDHAFDRLKAAEVAGGVAVAT
ncbi:MAG TPA: hypothetical protein VNT25_06840 [Allosphingosinicella sp.]|nr:hypothetical protein [Allosphingosinicella sp.]